MLEISNPIKMPTTVISNLLSKYRKIELRLLDTLDLISFGNVPPTEQRCTVNDIDHHVLLDFFVWGHSPKTNELLKLLLLFLFKRNVREKKIIPAGHQTRVLGQASQALDQLSYRTSIHYNWKNIYFS